MVSSHLKKIVDMGIFQLGVNVKECLKQPPRCFFIIKSKRLKSNDSSSVHKWESEKLLFSQNQYVPWPPYLDLPKWLGSSCAGWALGPCSPFLGNPRGPNLQCHPARNSWSLIKGFLRDYGGSLTRPHFLKV